MNIDTERDENGGSDEAQVPLMQYLNRLRTIRERGDREVPAAEVTDGSAG